MPKIAAMLAAIGIWVASALIFLALIALVYLTRDTKAPAAGGAHGSPVGDP